MDSRECYFFDFRSETIFEVEFIGRCQLHPCASSNGYPLWHSNWFIARKALLPCPLLLCSRTRSRRAIGWLRHEKNIARTIFLCFEGIVQKIPLRRN